MRQKKSKAAEYPGIEWNHTERSDVQLCVLLYDDRINQYHKMQALRKVLIEAEDFSVIPSLIEATIRHDSATDELRSYEKTHQFIYRHPIAVSWKKQVELSDAYSSMSSEDIYKQVVNNSNMIRKIRHKIAHLDKCDIARKTELDNSLQLAINKRDILLSFL